ncbi:MAG: heavy metal translocating P-type ATPase metal-binding domain-containing protein [Candidatus Kapaibacterium sp.]
MVEQNDKLICYHCGDGCPDDTVRIDNKIFCCNGCKTVHQLLEDVELGEIFEETKVAGIKSSKYKEKEFEFLDDRKIIERIIHFSIEGRAKVTLYLPQIYCSACLYLVENLNKLDKGIIDSKVNFLKKEATILFDERASSLRKIVELLTAIGYRPQLNYSDIEKPKQASYNKNLYLKLGLAGFAFGNVMLMALPEYLSGGNLEPDIQQFMGYLTMLLSIPAMYASSDYFKSAYTSLKVGHVNIDVPLSIGILVLFLRSIFDISLGYGSGFVDSLSGLVFFLLVGKIFQQKTYHNLSFSRDYKSYFPLSVVRLLGSSEEYVAISELKVGDRLLIRNNEIIPADSILLSGTGMVDYSFVTGESNPVRVSSGNKIFAGGKQSGNSITVETIKPFNQSYLTELWNSDAFKKFDESYISFISNRAAKYFTLVIFLVAAGTLAYWLPKDFGTAMDAVTTVLIIACPCAIALSMPFTYGTALRILGKNNFYLKNDKIVEYLSNLKTVVFDKTGTLTELNSSIPEFEGNSLSNEELAAVKSITRNSTHPVSRIIFDSIDSKFTEIGDFEEVVGKGIEAIINGKTYKLGSAKWVDTMGFSIKSGRFSPESRVYLSIDGNLRGAFVIKSRLREGIEDIISKIKSDHKIIILSGDNPTEKAALEIAFGDDVEMHFNKLPQDKLNFIQDLQSKGEKVMMIGDGLNDAGALKQSDVGIAVTDNTSNFTPGSDAILIAGSMNILDKFIKLSRKSVNTIYWSYVISVLYHGIGFYFATQAMLSPLIAAILMPVSSVSVVLLTVSKVTIHSKKIGLK